MSNERKVWPDGRISYERRLTWRERVESCVVFVGVLTMIVGLTMLGMKIPPV